VLFEAIAPFHSRQLAQQYCILKKGVTTRCRRGRNSRLAGELLNQLRQFSLRLRFGWISMFLIDATPSSVSRNSPIYLVLPFAQAAF